jgi:hypothetical protein
MWLFELPCRAVLREGRPTLWVWMDGLGCLAKISISRPGDGCSRSSFWNFCELYGSLGWERRGEVRRESIYRCLVLSIGEFIFFSCDYLSLIIKGICDTFL